MKILSFFLLTLLALYSLAAPSIMERAEAVPNCIQVTGDSPFKWQGRYYKKDGPPISFDTSNTRKATSKNHDIEFYTIQDLLRSVSASLYYFETDYFWDHDYLLHKKVFVGPNEICAAFNSFETLPQLDPLTMVIQRLVPCPGNTMCK